MFVRNIDSFLLDVTTTLYKGDIKDGTLDDYVKFNEKSWDNFSDANYKWTNRVSGETIKLAKSGVWDVVITPMKSVPKSWFPKRL